MPKLKAIMIRARVDKSGKPYLYVKDMSMVLSKLEKGLAYARIRKQIGPRRGLRKGVK